MSDGPNGGTTGWQIVIAEIDPNGEVTSHHPLKFDLESGDEMLPSWSPDGTQFAFIHMKDDVYQIGLGRPDGSGFRLVGPETGDRNGLGYAWSPDGQTLLIASRRGDVVLWSVDVASGDATAVDGPADRIPAWQRLAP
jgi:Tol biopolymer transport system component